MDIEAYTLNAGNPNLSFYCLRSTGKQAKGILGKTGAGLSLGATKEEFERLYGTHHTFDHITGTDEYEASVNWEGRSSLTVTFGAKRKVKSIKVLADVE